MVLHSIRRHMGENWAALPGAATRRCHRWSVANDDDLITIKRSGRFSWFSRARRHFLEIGSGGGGGGRVVGGGHGRRWKNMRLRVKVGRRRRCLPLPVSQLPAPSPATVVCATCAFLKTYGRVVGAVAFLLFSFFRFLRFRTSRDRLVPWG